jgi:hypothetical protein
MDNSAVSWSIIMIFAIPIVAIIGGITAGIMKTRGRERLVELAQRERIAAIEKGIDPAKLPPLPLVGNDATTMNVLERAFERAMPTTPRQAELRRAQGFLISGLILLAIGLGLSIMLLILPEAAEHRAWAAGLIPAFIGLALLVSSAIVRKDAPADTNRPDGPRA